MKLFVIENVNLGLIFQSVHRKIRNKAAREVMDLITQMARENKQTLIIVTHDIEISTFAHRIVYIRDGNIEKIEANKIKEAK